MQTSDGKIVAVYHSRDENNDAVDFKKSIAAAFQANFKGTEQEEEDDPQSDHIAHYRCILVLHAIVIMYRQKFDSTINILTA